MITLPPATYSWLNDDENCPRKGQHKHVLKDLPREAMSPAGEWGRKVHDSFAKRLVVKEPLPEGMRSYERYALALDNMPGIKLVEQNIAITSDGRETDFFADNVWLRGRPDYALVNQNAAVILDWKTGKVDENPFELEVQGLLLKCKFPGIESAVAHYVWLRDNRLGAQHDVSNFARTMNDVRLRMRDIEARPLDGSEWVAKPNPLCGWCPVKTCPHNTNRS